VKKTGRGESIGVVTHICMETTQGICAAIFISNWQKHHVHLFHVLCFFSSSKSETRREEQILPMVGGGTGGRG
jgi:hypothetical protein